MRFRMHFSACMQFDWPQHFSANKKKRDEKKEWSLKTRKTRETRNFVRFDCIWLHVCLGCSLLLFDCNWPRRPRRKLGWPKRNVAIIDVLSAATLQIANCRCRIADWRVISRGRRCKMEGIIFSVWLLFSYPFVWVRFSINILLSESVGSYWCFSIQRIIDYVSINCFVFVKACIRFIIQYILFLKQLPFKIPNKKKSGHKEELKNIIIIDIIPE